MIHSLWIMAELCNSLCCTNCTVKYFHNRISLLYTFFMPFWSRGTNEGKVLEIETTYVGYVTFNRNRIHWWYPFSVPRKIRYFCENPNYQFHKILNWRFFVMCCKKESQLGTPKAKHKLPRKNFCKKGFFRKRILPEYFIDFTDPLPYVQLVLKRYTKNKEHNDLIRFFIKFYNL